MAHTKPSRNPNVGLFVTCLVDLFRPSVGFAAVKLLQEAGCHIEVPLNQTCCGQPTYNSGNQKDTRIIARKVIEAFEKYDFVVVPSGSCAGMIKIHYPKLFVKDPEMKERLELLKNKTFELTSFLIDVMELESVADEKRIIKNNKVTYHDSCSGLRELKIKKQPRELLKNLNNLNVTEYGGAEVCCGFGGIFCIKYSEISDQIVQKSIDNLEKTEADLLLGGDLGCLMNIQGKLSRLNQNKAGFQMQVRHVAEVLAGLTEKPAIGESKG